MKKVEVKFVCDICGKPLPDEFVKENGCGEKYFDFNTYNTMRISLTKCVSVQIDVYETGCCERKELCPQCRSEILRQYIHRLDYELEEKL